MLTAHRRKLALVLAVFLLGSLVLVGCNSGGDGGTGGGTSTAGAATSTLENSTPDDGETTGIVAKDSIVIHNAAIPNKLDPQFCSSSYEYGVTVNINEGFFMPWREDMTDVRPWLVESYEVSDDYLTYTFKLHEGVLFHNGEELTADDGIYTLERAKTSAMTAPTTSPMESFEKLDKYTFNIHLSAPYPILLEVLCFEQMGVVNKALYEEYGEGAREAIVGTGPYKFVDWTSDNSITLEYFEDWWGVDFWGFEPQVKQVTYRSVIDLTAAVIAFESGELDLLTNVSTQDCERLIKTGNFSSVEFFRGARWGISINNQDPVFSDLRVRQAMNHATDKEAINQIAGEGVQNTNILAKTHQMQEGYQKALKEGRLTEYPYDVEKAKDLMAEAGYDENNRITTSMLCNQTTTAQAFSTAVQDQLSQIGIDIEVEVMETATWLNRLGTRDFRISWAEWGPQWYWPSIIYYFYYHDGLFYNYENINLPVVNEMTELGMSEMDKEKREEYYAKVLEEVTAQATLVPVWQCKYYAITTKGLKVYPDDVNRFCPVVWMEWTDEEPFQYDAEWIDNDEQR